MAESRICPVCENEIPEDARYFCPNCRINLQLLEDEEAIARARKFFPDKSFKVSEQPEDEVDSRIWIYYVGGGVAGLIVGLYYFIICNNPPLLFACPIGGIIIGSIGHLLNRFAITNPRKIVVMILTIVLSIIASGFIGIIFIMTCF